jgi:hypothetical protein
MMSALTLKEVHVRRIRKIKALLRAGGIVASVAALAGGVTFAALQSQQNVLSGNTIETATANLMLSKDGNSFSNSQTGYDFSNIIPGGPAVPTAGYPIYLKNNGGTPLALKLAVISTPSNPNNVDLSKVNVLLTIVGVTAPVQSFPLQSLVNGSAAFGTLDTSNTVEYKLQVSMATDAVTGNSAALGNIDFAFSGSAVSN